MLENNCSEHASRMSAMENSTKSAGEMLERLTLKCARARAQGGGRGASPRMPAFVTHAAELEAFCVFGGGRGACGHLACRHLQHGAGRGPLPAASSCGCPPRL